MLRPLQTTEKSTENNTYKTLLVSNRYEIGLLYTDIVKVASNNISISIETLVHCQVYLQFHL